MKDYKIEYLITEQDFEYTCGRKPKNLKEFEEFCHLAEKGLNSTMDWTTVFNCAMEAME